MLSICIENIVKARCNNMYYELQKICNLQHKTMQKCKNLNAERV